MSVNLYRDHVALLVRTRWVRTLRVPYYGPNHEVPLVPIDTSPVHRSIPEVQQFVEHTLSKSLSKLRVQLYVWTRSVGVVLHHG